MFRRKSHSTDKPIADLLSEIEGMRRDIAAFRRQIAEGARAGVRAGMKAAKR